MNVLPVLWERTLQRPGECLSALGGRGGVGGEAVGVGEGVVGGGGWGVGGGGGEEHDRRVGRERLPEHAFHDVVVDVVHALVAELRIAQAADRVVFVEALLGLGGR